jgi:fatty acid/phospholipid biosynthesis enzyme
MCPICIVSAAAFAVSVTSSGGVVALALIKVRRIKRFRRPNPVSKAPETKMKEKQS